MRVIGLCIGGWKLLNNSLIHLAMASQQITFEIDLDKIFKDFLEKDVSGEPIYRLEGAIKHEIKERAKQKILDDVYSKLDIGELIENGYSRKWLTGKAQEILKERLDSYVNEFAETYFKKNLPYIIQQKADEMVKEWILPIMQKIVSNLMVVDSSDIDSQIKQLEEYAHDMANNAYESGAHDGYNDARNAL